MLRKLLPVPLHIDAQKVTTLTRVEETRRRGHADRAAKALRLAETQGYELLVFVKDVDKQPGKKTSPIERRKKLRAMHSEIQQGFDEVDGADEVLRIKATPCRMLEAWALGDVQAIRRVVGPGAHVERASSTPEDLWGDEQDPASNHPKCVLRRIVGGAVNAWLFERLAAETNPATLRKTCPDSFAPFADEVAEAAKTINARSAARARSRGARKSDR
jgi:hypothetical protein